MNLQYRVLYYAMLGCLTLVVAGPDLVPRHGDSLGPQIRSEHGHLRRGHLQIFSRFQDPQ